MVVKNCLQAILILSCLTVAVGCVKTAAHKEELEAPPVVVTTKNFRNVKARCASLNEASDDVHKVHCNAVVATEGDERPVTGVAPEIKLDWEKFVRVAGTEPLSIACSVEASGVSQLCQIQLTSAEAVTLRTTLSATEIQSGEMVSNSAEVVLPFAVRNYGHILELPVAFSPPSVSESSTNLRSAVTSVSNDAVEEKKVARLVERDYDAFQSNLVPSDFPTHSCSLGDTTYISVLNYIYSVANGRLRLFAGSPTKVRALPEATTHRKRLRFDTHPTIECVEDPSGDTGTIYAASLYFEKNKDVLSPFLVATEIKGDEVVNRIVPFPQITREWTEITGLAIEPSGAWLFSVWHSLSISAVFRYVPGETPVLLTGGVPDTGKVPDASTTILGKITDVTISEDKTIFVADSSAKRIRKIGLDGGLSEFPVSGFTFAHLRGLAFYQGNLYATDLHGTASSKREGPALLSISPSTGATTVLSVDYKSVGTPVFGALSASRRGVLTSMSKAYQFARLKLNEKPLRWEHVGGRPANHTAKGTNLPVDRIRLHAIQAIGQFEGRILVQESGRDLISAMGRLPSNESYATGYLYLGPPGLPNPPSRVVRVSFLKNGGVAAIIDRSSPRLAYFGPDESKVDLVCHETSTDCDSTAIRFNFGVILSVVADEKHSIYVVDQWEGIQRIIHVKEQAEGARVASVLLTGTALASYQRTLKLPSIGHNISSLQIGPAGDLFFVTTANPNQAPEGRLVRYSPTGGQIRILAGLGRTSLEQANKESLVDTLQLNLSKISVAQSGVIFGTDDVNRVLFLLQPSAEGDSYTYEKIGNIQSSYEDCGFGTIERKVTQSDVTKEWKATLGQVCIGNAVAIKIVDQCQQIEKRQTLLLAQEFHSTSGINTVIETTRPCP